MIDAEVSNCVSCLENVSGEAKLLPCLHTVCSNCVESTNSCKFVCPACNQEFDNSDVTNHFVLRSLHFRSLMLHLPQCSSCLDLNAPTRDKNVLAKYSCTDCPTGENLCDECASAHKRVKQTRHHRLNEINSSVPADFLVNNKCPAHPNELLSLHCTTCNEVTCVICQLFQHNGHKHEKLELLIKSTRLAIDDSLKIVNNLNVKCKRFISKNDQHLMDFETEQDELLKRLNKEVDELKAAIDKRSQDLKESIGKFYSDKASRCSERIRRVETIKISANQASIFAQFVLKCDDFVDLKKGRKYVDASLENIVKSYTEETERETLETGLSLKFSTGQMLNEIGRFGELVHLEVKPQTLTKSNSKSTVKSRSIGSPVSIEKLTFPQTTVTLSHNLWQVISDFAQKDDNFYTLMDLIKNVKMTRHTEDGVWFITGDLKDLKFLEETIKVVLGLEENSNASLSLLKNISKCNFEKMLPNVSKTESLSVKSPLTSKQSDTQTVPFPKIAVESISKHQKHFLTPTFSEKSNESCPICLEKFSTVQRRTVASCTVKLPMCKHEFHKSCVELWLKKKASCPVCQKRYGPPLGNQPAGKISVVVFREKSVAGFADSDGCIAIKYDIPHGIQGPDHPNPGKPFTGTTRVAFLPNNPRGRKIVTMLEVAFNCGLIFTVGTSMTSGVTNTVVWANIPHKTSLEPGAYGYPDDKYLDRVEEQLRIVGICENELVFSS